MEPDFVRIASDIVNGVLTDLSAMGAASLLEGEIERRGLEETYADALLDLTGAVTGIEQYNFWLFIRATPEQRAQAFLKAVA